MYLLMSTVGYTVLVGTAIHKYTGQMPRLFYFIGHFVEFWLHYRVTVFNVTDPEFKPVLPAKKLEYSIVSSDYNC